MARFSLFVVLLALLLALSPNQRTTASSARTAATPRQAGALKFDLRFSAQLEKYPEAKAAFQRAAARWERAIQSPITVLVELDYGPNLSAEPSLATERLAVTRVQSTSSDSSGRFSFIFFLRDKALTVEQAAVFAALPDKFITDAGEWGGIYVPTPIARAVGYNAFPTPQPEDEQLYGPNPAIAFKASAQFDFDARDGIDPGKIDFEAAATREFGRLLGFTTSADDPYARRSPTVWDLYRFRAGVALDTFTDTPRTQLPGGEQVFYAGGLELPLSTARADGTGGDGRPAGHWKDDALTGQYIGVMDPTITPGERGPGLTANDLGALQYFGYDVRDDAPVAEVLSIDDGTTDTTIAGVGRWIVNRLTPSRYPATLQAVRVRRPQGASGPFRLIVFADPARTGAPSAHPQLLVDRVVTPGALPASGLLEVVLQAGPTIAAGDLYIGVQAGQPSQPSQTFAIDTSQAFPNRSFISVDDGATFQPFTVDGDNATLMARAVVSSTFGGNAIPRLASLSPSTAVPGDGTFTLTVYGDNFQGLRKEGFSTNSLVRWNGQERPTQFLSNSLLQATIYDIDIAQAGTAEVSVFTRTLTGDQLLSSPLKFTVTPNLPAPKLAALTPNTAVTGNAPGTILVRGREFNPRSKARWNGADRQTEFVDSTQLKVTLLPADLAATSTAAINVVTPAPGGGASNALPFTVAPCRYRLEGVTQPYSSNALASGLVVSAPDSCAWTARSDASWIKLTNAASRAVTELDGKGSGLLKFSLDNNRTGAARAGTITLGDQQLTVRQLDNAAATSAASFSAEMATDSIGTLFGNNLALKTEAATAVPLPTTLAGATVRITYYGGQQLDAPLFFASPKQINFLLPRLNMPDDPDNFWTRSADVAVLVNGQSVADGTMKLSPTAVGLFSANANGTGIAAGLVLRVRPDGTQRYEPIAAFDPATGRNVAQPIVYGDINDRLYLVLFGTGLRRRSSLGAVRVTLGTTDVPVLYAGPQGDLLGLDQINVALPQNLRGLGEARVRCTIDGRGANQLTITVQ